MSGTISIARRVGGYVVYVGTEVLANAGTDSEARRIAGAYAATREGRDPHREHLARSPWQGKQPPSVADAIQSVWDWQDKRLASDQGSAAAFALLSLVPVLLVVVFIARLAALVAGAQ